MVDYMEEVDGGVDFKRGTITSLTKNGAIANGFSVKYCNLLPFNIDEDLLFKLGFKKEVEDITKDKRYRLRLNGFCIDINKYSNTLGRDYSVHIDNDCCDSVPSGDIQYLHQLQNYIYDSTKQELNIEGIS